MPEHDRWAYLTSEPFRARQALAAHFTQYLDVLEIGGWKTPCANTNVNVDPLSEDCDETIEPVRLDIEDYLGTRDAKDWFDQTNWYPAGYAVVALGLDLPEIGPLTARLLQGAQRVVVETAVGYDRGMQNIGAVHATLWATHRILAELRMTIDGEDIPEADGYPIYANRLMRVYERVRDANAA